MQSVQLVPFIQRRSLVVEISRHKRRKRLHPIIRTNLRQYLHPLITTSQNTMRTSRFRLQLLQRQLPQQSQRLKHERLLQHRLQSLKDLACIQSFFHNYRSVWRCSTMELSIGLWVNFLHSVHFSRPATQSALQDKIRVAEHLATATQ